MILLLLKIVLPLIQQSQKTRRVKTCLRIYVLIKKTLDMEKYSSIANAQVLNEMEALSILECLEREEDIDSAYRLALQKYNLTHFYKKAPEDITVDFVETYSKKEMRSAYSALVQAMDSLDNLRTKRKLIIENDPREKASCDSLLPKLEEILEA